MLPIRIIVKRKISTKYFSVSRIIFWTDRVSLCSVRWCWAGGPGCSPGTENISLQKIFQKEKIFHTWSRRDWRHQEGRRGDMARGSEREEREGAEPMGEPGTPQTIGVSEAVAPQPGRPERLSDVERFFGLKYFPDLADQPSGSCEVAPAGWDQLGRGRSKALKY